jgi:hypothetical protein
MHTAEPLLPETNPLGFEIAIENTIRILLYYDTVQ